MSFMSFASSMAWSSTAAVVARDGTIDSTLAWNKTSSPKLFFEALLNLEGEEKSMTVATMLALLTKKEI